MLHTAALPFVLRRKHDVVSGREITSTQDQLHGLLFLDGERLTTQWRTSREISHVGSEIRTDHELTRRTRSRDSPLRTRWCTHPA